MLKEKKTYFNIYSIFKEIKDIKKNTNSKNFVYEFVRSLKIL